MFTYIELTVYILPFLLQVFTQFIEFRRTGFGSRLVVLFSSALFVLGLLTVIGAYGFKDTEYHRLFFVLSRLFLFSGSILWILGQLAWLRIKVVIIDEDPPCG